MIPKEMTRELTTQQKISTIFTLAVPAMIGNILQTVVGFIDTLFVSQLGIIEITAVGVANAVLAIYITIFMTIGVGTSSMIARQVGAGNIVSAREIAKQATIISSVIGLLFGIITVFFAKPLLLMIGAEPKVLHDSITYFQIVAIPSIFISLMFIFGSVLRATGNTKTPMKVSLWINIIHIGLDYILIFGFFKWGGLGVAGAACATVIVRLAGTLLLYHYIQKSKLKFSLRNDASLCTEKFTIPILQLSMPVAIERLLLCVGQVLYFGLIIQIGTATSAAFTIAGKIETFSYMLGYGLAIAATTLVGQHTGSQNKKEAYQYGGFSFTN